MTTVIKSGSNTQHGEFYADFKPGGNKRYTGAENYGSIATSMASSVARSSRTGSGTHVIPRSVDRVPTGMYDKPAAQGGTQGQLFTTETTDYTLKLNYQLSRKAP